MTQSTLSIDEADPSHGDILSAGRVKHDQTHQVVYDGEHRQLFVNAVYGFRPQEEKGDILEWH